MATKSILLASADPQALDDISRVLGAEWMPTSVRSEAEVLEQLEKYAFDAFLVDFNLGSPDASELLNLALAERPETVRFLLAHEADLALVAAKVQGEHQILPKPIELTSLKRRIEDGVAPEPNSDPAGAAAGPSVTPKIPAIYTEVLRTLESPEVTASQVGEMIAQDEALTAEVLRLANSTYLGLPRNITNPVEAVEWLGIDGVKALVMALRFLTEHSHLKPAYLSFDEIWQHNINVALIARDLVLFETKDRALASQAFAAGLVHDLGKVVLVSNFDDLYSRVNSLARNQPVALWDIEKEMFGANHGEIGGCLVGMWNLPLAIVDATALHHEPPVGEQQEFTPLAAVHIANVLEHQLRPSEEYQVAPAVSTPFLNELGLLQRLPVWRAAFANGAPIETEPEVESVEANAFKTSAPAISVARPSRAAIQRARPATRRTAAYERSASEESVLAVLASLWRGRWVYGGVAAALLLLVVLWFGTQRETNESLPVYARAPGEGALGVISPPSPEISPAAVPQALPASPVAVETPKPVPPPSVPEPTSTIASRSAVTNTPLSATAPPVGLTNAASASTAPVTAPTNAVPPSPAPVLLTQKKAAEFRLNGIIYTVTRPSAILNGITVHVGDQLEGAMVIAIGPKQVTLQIKGRLKNYSLE